MRQVLVWLGIADDGEPLALPLLATLAIELVAGLVVFFVLRALDVPFTWPLLVVVLIVLAADGIRRSRRR